jgi:MOSC domain-containing protein YiiM
MIKAIYVAQKPRQPLHEVSEVQVVFGCGITGDRHFKKGKRAGQNITFIEMEAIEYYNAHYGQAIDAGATRRNVLTQGVDLNTLVGQEFSIGQARFKGVELCQPCRVLGRVLENETISNAQVVRAFLFRAGLRADVIAGGIISVGMPLICTDS